MFKFPKIVLSKRYRLLSVFVLVLLCGLAPGVKAAIIFGLALVSAIVVHEFGHWFFASLFKCEIFRVEFGMVSGVVFVPPDSKKQLAIITAAGPMANFISSSIAWGLMMWLGHFTLIGSFLSVYWLYSSATGLFNLIPFPGSDGYSLLKILKHELIVRKLKKHS